MSPATPQLGHRRLQQAPHEAGRHDESPSPAAHLLVCRTIGIVNGRPSVPSPGREVALDATGRFDMEIPAAAQALLGSDAVAHVWTSNPDGSPQISVVWVLISGDEILFGTDGSSRKARNLARDPSIILSIEDTERNERGFQRHLIIRGRAAIEPSMPAALVDGLCRKYTGLASHPLSLRDSATAVTVRVAVERISGVGPWVAEPALR